MAAPVTTVVMYLIITMIYPHTGKVEQEKVPVEVPVCLTVDGVRVEDETCGAYFCLKAGRERAAVLWGRFPGLRFINNCIASDGASTSEGAGAAGGHPALGFQ